MVQVIFHIPVLYDVPRFESFKGSVKQKLRPMLLYIIRKLFSRRWSAGNFFFYFLKGPVHNLHKTPSADLSHPNYFCKQM